MLNIIKVFLVLLTVVSCVDVQSEQLTVNTLKKEFHNHHKKSIKVKGYLKYENNTGFLYDSKADADSMNLKAELLIHTDLKLAEFDIEKCSGRFVVIDAKLGTGAMIYLYDVENIYYIEPKTNKLSRCWPN